MSWQHGFVPQKSTAINLFKVTEHIVIDLEKIHVIKFKYKDGIW